MIVMINAFMYISFYECMCKMLVASRYFLHVRLTVKHIIFDHPPMFGLDTRML